MDLVGRFMAGVTVSLYNRHKGDFGYTYQVPPTLNLYPKLHIYTLCILGPPTLQVPSIWELASHLEALARASQRLG